MLLSPAMARVCLALALWRGLALPPGQASLRRAPVFETLDAAPTAFAFTGEAVSLPEAVKSPVTEGSERVAKALEKFEHYVTGQETGVAYDPGDLGARIRQEAAAPWEPVLHAQALTHERRRSLERPSGPSPRQRWAELAHAVPVEELLFCLCGLGVVLLLDLAILQELPETDRTHATLLAFWILLASAFGTEAWFRLGPLAGAQWATGYVMEVAYSAPHIFLFHFTFTLFATPLRLMGKALFIVTVWSASLRVPLFLGVADVLGSTTVLYGFGIWMMYCGLREALSPPTSDVTHLPVVKLLRSSLGDRFGEFYDEDGEAVVLFPERSEDRVQVTLLGPVILGLLLMELLGAVEPSLAKAQAIPNAYLNVSSSALALLTVRALFFLVRSLFGRYAFFRHATAAALVLMGARMVLAQLVQVSATAACLILVAYVLVSSLVAAAMAEQGKARSAWAAPRAAAAA